MVSRDGKIMYVICFYWEGDRWQPKGYVPDGDHKNLQEVHMARAGQIDPALPSVYVNNLYRGVKRFATRPFKFICFTNTDLNVLDEVEIRKFPLHTKAGVLPRVFMFSREAGLFGHQVLCLDLDIVIVGSLKNIMEYEGLFCARSKFKPGEEHKLDGDIMSFKASKVSEHLFWTPFIKDIKAAEQLTQGRERYWMRHVADDFAERWDVHAPGQVLSYKRHIKRGRHIPNGVSIISCHGIPRPHQIRDPWIKEYWNVD